MMRMILLSVLVISLCNYVVLSEEYYDDDIESIEEHSRDLKIEELNEVTDCENKAIYGARLSVHWTGTLNNGIMFGST